MKLSVNWLKDYVTPGVATDKLVKKLTMAGLEVETVSSCADDTVLDIEVTPNRPDCLNMLGLAREVGAIFNKPVKAPDLPRINFPKQKCPIVIDDREGCLRYIGTVVENLRVAPADPKIQKRIMSMGLRPINNIVDITNFCLMETGQPLHAFDYDKLMGGTIIVRRAQKGEKIVTIDGVQRDLDPSVLVIADAKRPVAIAGVMGGKETEVTGTTKNILLESAYFDPILVRRTSRHLGLTSDSSYRFERGVTMPMVNHGAQRALALILKQAQGQITQRADVFGEKKKVRTFRIKISAEEINGFLGSKISPVVCRGILKRLGLDVAGQGKQGFIVTPPIFRQDIKEKVDVFEEVARVIGYDDLPEECPVIKAAQVPENEKRTFRREVRQALLSQGLDEVITYTMISQEDLDKSRQVEKKGLRIRNPLTQDQELLRPTLLPSFLKLVQSNFNRQQKAVCFFETGKIYTTKGEQETLGLVLAGKRSIDWRKEENATMDFYDLKGIGESLFRSLRIQTEQIRVVKEGYPFFEEGQSATILLRDKILGVLGKLSEEVLSSWDIKEENVFFAEINLDALMACPTQEKVFSPLSDYPTVTRDISLSVSVDVPFSQVKEVIRNNGAGLLWQVNFVEEYLGEKIAQGQKGLVVSLDYLSQEKTLTDEEVSAVHEKICASLKKELDVSIR